MVRLRDPVRREAFGGPLSDIVDNWLPGLASDPDSKRLVDWLRQLSTVRKDPEGDKFIHDALARSSGPVIFPEMPPTENMPKSRWAYVDPGNAESIQMNRLLLDAFGDVGHDPDTVKFFKGLILHELVHWCRFKNPDSANRSHRRDAEYGEQLENIFHGRNPHAGALPLPDRLCAAFSRRLVSAAPKLMKAEERLAATSAETMGDTGRTDMTIIRRNRFAGVPLHYDRFNPDRSDYGTIGKPVNPEVQAAFADKCDAAFADIFQRLKPRFGNPAAIVTGGIGRSGSGNSYHHQNRAFDLDALAFPEHPIWVANSFPRRPHLYLAIESDLRRHFGVVLTYHYNAAHEDHIHFDDSEEVAFRRAAKTHTLYVQHALKYIYLKPVGLDGLWGPDTEDALDSVLAELNVGPISKKANWLTFCELTAMHAVEMAD